MTDALVAGPPVELLDEADYGAPMAKAGII
jgi:hypothetical protein